jgi:hypothetical protein
MPGWLEEDARPLRWRLLGRGHGPLACCGRTVHASVAVWLTPSEALPLRCSPLLLQITKGVSLLP